MMLRENQFQSKALRMVEIKLPTISGKVVTLKERVAISSKVSQPILCFGHLLEQGFGIDGVEQALVHAANHINISTSNAEQKYDSAWSYSCVASFTCSG